jgi:CRISPR-associated protein Csx10
MRQVLTLTIKFESDWHIGSGGSRFGQVDALVCRDPIHKLPYVPAKTLKGIWRDACEDLALALDHALHAEAIDQKHSPPSTKWASYVDLIFGKQSSKDDPGSSEGWLQVDAAYFGEKDRAFLKGPCGSALTALRPGIAVNVKTGVVDANMLRIEERVAKNAELCAKLCLQASGTVSTEQTDAARALLVAGANLVSHLGGNRRRGAGRCTFEVRWDGNGIKDERCRELLSEPPKVAAGYPGYPFSAAGTTSPFSGTAKRYRLTLTTEQPVVIPKLKSGNVVESRDELPGSDLLPALMPYFKGNRVKIRASIASGALSLTPGYLKGFQRTPLCFDQLKEGEGLPIRNLLSTSNDEDVGSDSVKQRKMLRGGYLKFEGANHQSAKVKFHASLHAVIDDVEQRPNQASGGLYCYQAIAPGQVFEAELLLPADIEFDKDACKAVQLGIARATGYGRVSVKGIDITETVVVNPPSVAAQSSTATTQTGCSEATQASSANARRVESFLVLVLRSPLLCLDESLQWSPTLAAFRAMLKRDCPDIHKQVKWQSEHQTFLASERYDGWLRSINMPKPSLIALAAGSVLKLKLKANAYACKKYQNAISKLEQKGLGERRAEGFGWIEVNPQWSHTDEFAAITPPHHPPVQIGEKTATFQKCIEKRYWRDQMVLRAQAKAKEAASELKLSELNTTQISQLIEPARAGHSGITEFFAAAIKSARYKVEWTRIKAAYEALVATPAGWPPPDVPSIYLGDFFAKLMLAAVQSHRHEKKTNSSDSQPASASGDAQ